MPKHYKEEKSGANSWKSKVNLSFLVLLLKLPHVHLLRDLIQP